MESWECIDKVTDYIEENLETLKAAIYEQPTQQKKQWSSLNEIFRKALIITEKS